MRRKSLLAIAVISLASSNAFSMEIVKGGVLDHKVWSTAGNSTSLATFKENPFDKNLSALLLNKHKYDPMTYVYVADRMNDTPKTVSVGDSLDVGGNATSFIINNSTSRKGFLISNGVCHNPVRSGLNECMIESYNIYLDVGGYINFSNEPAWQGMMFDQVGRVLVSIATEIVDQTEGKTVFSSDDYRIINVDPVKR